MKFTQIASLPVGSSAMHCNALQCTAMHCTAIQCTALQYNALQHTAKQCHALPHTATHCHTLPRTATDCHALLHTTTHCNTLLHTATHCYTLQHTCAFHYGVATVSRIDSIIGLFCKVTFRKLATNYTALFQKMTYTNKAPSTSFTLPLCTTQFLLSCNLRYSSE